MIGPSIFLKVSHILFLDQRKVCYSFLVVAYIVLIVLMISIKIAKDNLVRWSKLPRSCYVQSSLERIHCSRIGKYVDACFQKLLLGNNHRALDI